MKENQSTITVNGQAYDKITGLPVSTSDARPPITKKPTTNAHILHASAGRSKTLRRPTTAKKTGEKTEVKPASKPMSSDIIPRKRPTSAKQTTVSRPSSISKFTPVQKKTAANKADITPRNHPHALKVAQRQAAQSKTVAAPRPLSPKDTKNDAINKALTEAKPVSPAMQHKQKKTKKRSTRLVQIWGGITCAALIVAAIVWVNLPTLSITVAAAQSGVKATIPHFKPDGYTLRLPIEAKSNHVSMTYSSNQNDTSFTLTQEKSSWDSQAVRAWVTGQSNGQFLTTNDRGLTIYTFDGSAAWVNAGILYKIAGGAHISNDAILRIANSL